MVFAASGEWQAIDSFPIDSFTWSNFSGYLKAHARRAGGHSKAPMRKDGNNANDASYAKDSSHHSHSSHPSERLLPPRGDYQTLLSFQEAEIVYDITFRFAHKYYCAFVETRP